MVKLKNFIKRKKYLLVAILVVIILLFLALSGQKNNFETYIVEKVAVEQSVLLSGKVETSDRADLGFASSGRINRISVENNQKVSKGQVLAQLEIGDLLADLRIKEANVRSTDVDLKSAKDELAKVTAQEDAKVASTYRNLLSEGLVATPSSSSYSANPPRISGLYNGAEGTYKIIIARKNAGIDDYEVRTFNLENSTREINEQGPTQFGTRGLYISFTDDLSQYHDTTWYVEIPNKSDSSYLANYNAYIEAKNARELAIKTAQAEYDRILTREGDTASSVALAEIQKINAEIRKNTIYAPFAGIVTNIQKEPGENASLGETIVSVLGEDTLEVVLQVSELDVSKLVPDADIAITLDAFKEEVFNGKLKTINSKETTVDGVPVYEAFVELAPDPRIKAGMSASGTIVLASKSDVLAVPSYILQKDGEEVFVEVVLVDGKKEKRVVVPGLVGSDSMTEIISGLDAGESVLITN